MNRVLHHVRHNVVAYLALFIALGGTSYAAVSLPKNSVGAAQIRNHSITPVKFASKSIHSLDQRLGDLAVERQRARSHLFEFPRHCP